MRIVLGVRSHGAIGPSTALNVGFALTASRLSIRCSCSGSRRRSFSLRCLSSNASCPLVTGMVIFPRLIVIFETSKL